MKRLAWPSQLHPQYLGLVALFLLIMGIAAAVVTGGWGWLPVLLVAVAGMLLLAWLVIQTRISGSFFGRRSTQVGTNALLSLLAVLVLLGILNFLGTRYNTQFDLTDGGQFTLAPESQEVLQALPDSVNILVFDPNPSPQQRLLLEQFRQRAQGKLSVEFVDPQAQPGLAKKFNVQRVGDVILEAGNRSQPLEGELNESNLTPALVKVTQSGSTRAYFTQGHGELPLSGGNQSLAQAIDFLNKRNVETNPLNLLENPVVPENADVVIVAGPQQAFLAPEVTALENFLKRGGSVLLMLDPDVNTGLEPLLKNWGVALDNRWVIDGSGIGQQVGLGPDVIVTTAYGTHPITQKFAQGPTLFPRAQALMITPQATDQVVDLVSSSAQSWAEADPQSEIVAFDQAQDKAGPLTLGVAISRPVTAATPENTPPANNSTNPNQESRLVVFGDSDFASNGVFEQGVNGDLLINSVLWLGDRTDQPLSIRAKETTNRRLQLSVVQSRWLGVISLLVLPLVGFGLAIGAWWQRR